MFAARMGDMHVCPMVTGVVPHVGGPITKGCPTVMIGYMPAARVGDPLTCVGPPDVIAPPGSPTVLIGGMPAARMLDMTVHGGVIMPLCCPTVLIGTGGGGGAAGAASGGAGAGAGGGAGAAAGGGGTAAAVARSSEASVSSVPADHTGPLAPAEEDEDEPTWIGIRLQDFTGQPMPNQQFQVTLEGGQVLSGTTDADGYARFDDIDPDQGEVAFTEIPEHAEVTGEDQEETQQETASPSAEISAEQPTQRDDDEPDFEALTQP